VEKWKSAPGMKDGKPVKILATVEVNFRLPKGCRSDCERVCAGRGGQQSKDLYRLLTV
jgi:hypothetical protein